MAQKLSGAQPPRAMPLCWLGSYRTPTGGQAQFKWEQDHNFGWGQPSSLMPGVNVTASQVSRCDPGGDNTVSFEPPMGFGPVTAGGPMGALTITCGASVPSDSYAVGIGMSGALVFAVQAAANLTYGFHPTPDYWLLVGDYRQGDVLDNQSFDAGTPVRFPPGVTDITCTLNADNSWTVSTS